MALFADIDVTRTLDQRPSRPPGYEAESRALQALVRELENPHGNVLGGLCELALPLCRAGSAGVSILESDGADQVFRWHAIRGAWTRYEGQSIPRSAGPCDATITQDRVYLLHHPASVFPVLATTDPPPFEALLAPFRILGVPMGTVWVLSHDESHAFDAEDARLVEKLAAFASSAFHVQQELVLARGRIEETYRVNQRLLAIVRKLQPQA